MIYHIQYSSLYTCVQYNKLIRMSAYREYGFFAVYTRVFDQPLITKHILASYVAQFLVFGIKGESVYNADRYNGAKWAMKRLELKKYWAPCLGALSVSQDENYYIVVNYYKQTTLHILQA